MSIEEVLAMQKSLPINRNLERPESLYSVPDPNINIRGFTPPTRPAVPQQANFSKLVFVGRLEEIEILYGERKIITTRHKVETELTYFFNVMRKKSYVPYLDEEELSICNRVDKAIDFLLTLSRKIDKIQQDEKIYANTQHIEVIFDLQ
jgi:hypothetical protein